MDQDQCRHSCRDDDDDDDIYIIHRTMTHIFVLSHNTTTHTRTRTCKLKLASNKNQYVVLVTGRPSCSRTAGIAVTAVAPTSKTPPIVAKAQQMGKDCCMLNNESKSGIIVLYCIVLYCIVLLLACLLVDGSTIDYGRFADK